MTEPANNTSTNFEYFVKGKICQGIKNGPGKI